MGAGKREPFTPARGSGQIPQVDDKATRKMDADQFRMLLQQEESRRRKTRAPTIPAADEMMSALVAQTAQTDRDDEDLAIAREESRPFTKAALIVPAHRLETRHANAIAPIAKPPPMGSGPRPALRPPAPRVDRTALVVSVICIALLAITIVLTLTT